MKRSLVTGMSATGKTTLIRELAARGYKAINLDSDEWSEWVAVDYDGDPSSPDSPAGPGREWVWREDRVRDRDAEVLFVSGCAENNGTENDVRIAVIRKTEPHPGLSEEPSVIHSTVLPLTLGLVWGAHPGRQAPDDHGLTTATTSPPDNPRPAA
jgi:hypothetical protein